MPQDDRLSHRRPARRRGLHAWLEKHLHPEGLRCPRCGSHRPSRLRAARVPSSAFAAGLRPATTRSCRAPPSPKTHQTPAKLVLILRGIAKGEPTARLARELAVSRRQHAHAAKDACRRTCSTRSYARCSRTRCSLKLMRCTRTRGKKGEPHRPRRSATPAGQ